MDMEFNHLLQYNLERWQRNILNSYWLVLCLTILTDTALVKWGGDSQASISRDIVIPAVLLVAIVGLTELAVWRMNSSHRSYVLLGAAEGIAFVLSVFHGQSPFVTITFLMPILISLFYFELGKVYVTAGTSIGFVLLLIGFDFHLRQHLSPISIVTIFGALLGGTYIAVHVTERGVEMVRHMKVIMDANEQLLIQSVMMESASKRDGLTNTYNHKSFHEHLDSLLRQVEQDRQLLRIHLIIMDIDDFKQVNDTFGHQSGDMILQRVADTIRHHCLPNDFLARYGGEEFALIMVGRSTAEAIQCGQAICASIAVVYHPEIRGRSVTISAGLAEHHVGQAKDALFNAADTALYCAKDRGKNQLVCAPDCETTVSSPTSLQSG